MAITFEEAPTTTAADRVVTSSSAVAQKLRQLERRMRFVDEAVVDLDLDVEKALGGKLDAYS